jgi:hemerythrin-like metal-binding protein
MYYSYFSTGNMQIDGEHTNIDCMIDLCRQKKGDWVPSARLLISGLANHLDSEERICQKEGLNMTPEHLEEHHMLKVRLALIEKQVNRGELEKAAFLTTLRDILFYHISNFDKQLKAADVKTI